jgi:hypothetical protein
VAQERVRIPSEPVLTLRDGGVADVVMCSDFCAYIWSDGGAEGCMVRSSEDARLNITTGATMRAVFVVDHAD